MAKTAAIDKLKSRKNSMLDPSDVADKSAMDQTNISGIIDSHRPLM